MRQLPGSVVKARAARLRAAGQAAQQRFLSAQIGRRVPILMERGGIGRTEHYAPVRPDFPVAAGSIVPVTITGLDGDVLRGEVA